MDLINLIEIDISEDSMSAEICLKPIDPSAKYEMPEIVDELTNQGIVYGVDMVAIEEMVSKKIYNKFMPVAAGTPAEDGADGHFKFYFDTAPSKKPKLLDNGSVDYRNLNLISSVEPGDLIAEYFGKKQGIDGIDVRGKILTAKPGKDLPNLRGKGFEISEDGTKYYAAIAGKVEMNMGVISILPICTIPGDVDLSVGNIDLKGDLEIMGSIKAGMIVKATGNITVGKLIEAAEVHAGKELLVRGGILGGGKAEISSVGNLFAQFIENARISSGSSIQADSIVNSDVTAYSDVNIFGKTSAIVGGHLKANRRVRTKSIGSEAGVKTCIEVGVDSKVRANLKQVEEELREEEEKLEKIEQAVKMFMSKNHNEMSAKEKNMYMQLVRTKIDKSAQVYRLKDIYTQVSRRIDIGKYAEVIAEKKVYPGVRLVIDGMPTVIENEYESIVFKRKGDKILSKKYYDEDYED